MPRTPEQKARHAANMKRYREQPLTLDGIEKFAERFFWPKVDKSGDCWLWMAYRDRNGYGHCGFQKHDVSAHRFSWMLANGRLVGDGLEIGHHCDNPPCVNPAHLVEWTGLENHRDKYAKGRAVNVVGERSGAAKISNARISELRNVAAELGWPNGSRGFGGNPELTAQIMALFPEVSHTQLSRVVRGKSRTKG